MEFDMINNNLFYCMENLLGLFGLLLMYYIVMCLNVFYLIK